MRDLSKHSVSNQRINEKSTTKNMEQPKAVIFDLLTALLDSWTIWDAVIPPEERRIADGTTWRKQYLELTYGCGSYKPYEDLVRQSAQDVGLSSASPKALVERYDEIGPWPEVPEVLVKLKNQGIKLAVVTNCSTDLGFRTVNNLERVVREKTACKDFVFDEIVTAEQSGYYKPHAKPYEDTLKKLGLEAKDALFVAGSPSDIIGASNVGMKVAWNNHIGLPRKSDLLPWREGKTLDQALGGILKS